MAVEADALNYPYIRIRDVEWLKRTLLIFPHVVRMTVKHGAPADAPEIAEFSWQAGRRGEPLLRPANLYTDRVESAQWNLMEELRRRGESEEFRRRFSKEATYGPELLKLAGRMDVWERRLSEDRAFQIHRDKVLTDLLEFLLYEGLAWTPEQPDGPQYVEMNRNLGDAIMATLAFACADDEGLRVVTEFPKLHSRVLHQPRDQIFSACLDEGEGRERPVGETMSPDRLAQFFVYVRCDASKLTPDRLAALGKERQAIADFKKAIEEIAETRPDIGNQKGEEAELQDAVNDVLRRWQSDQANLSGFVREIFGDGALNAPQKFIDKAAETVLGPGAFTTAGAFVHGLDGAAGGLAIGVAFQAVKAGLKARQKERASQFRYLTMMADHGVVFTPSA